MGLHIQTYKHHSSTNQHHHNIDQFIKSHLSVWGFLCIMIHSSIILAIIMFYQPNSQTGSKQPNSNIKEYTESWEKVGFETLHLSLDLDLEQEARERRLRSGHHHHYTAPARRERERSRREREREKERRERRREKRKKRSLTARVS